MAAIEVNNLTKRYGPLEALKGITFSVDEGEVFGLIGPNGAGKTTTLRVLSTLLEVTSGDVKIYGYDLVKQADEVRKIISYLPEDAGAYKNMKGMEYLRFIAAFFDDKDREQMLQRGIQIADLGDRLEDRIDTYSKGMQRRLLVARALMIKPKLAILDELTSGLDVINAQTIRRTVKESAKQGTTVLLSSHNMLEVELMCDRIALINDGRIVATGTPKDLKSEYHATNIEEVFVEVVK
ncbi:MAG TPA: ABC transporter ATP-binding protein [Methanomassiliicoccales archaeon]|nr:ABC transporter ATP-binding protein [Methanomassiliicoccales archaeon]